MWDKERRPEREDRGVCEEHPKVNMIEIKILAVFNHHYLTFFKIKIKTKIMMWRGLCLRD